MDLRLAIPEQNVTATVLDAGLEALTRLDEQQVRAGQAPHIKDAGLGKSLIWQPEPPGAECFDHAAKIVRRGWADCDDLAPYLAGSLRATGEDPHAVARVVKSGPNRWHAIVQRGDGTINDPSVDAGMPHSVVGDDGTSLSPPPPSLCICPPVLPRMFADNRPALAMRVNAVTGMYEARADLPWLDTDYAMSALSRSPVASTAIVGAIRAVCGIAKCAGSTHPRHLRKLSGLGALLMGHHHRDVASVVGSAVVREVLPLAYDLAVVGDFFGDIANAFKGAEPLLSKAAQFIPGVGPVASTALDIAAQMIPAQGGGAPQQAAAQAALTHPVMQQAMSAAMKHPAVKQAMAHAASRVAPPRPHAPVPHRPAPHRPAPMGPVVTHPGAAAAAPPRPASPRVLHIVPGQGGHVLMTFGA